MSYFIDLTKQIDLLRSPGNPPFACALLCRSLCLLGFAVLPASRACSLCLGRGGLHHKVSLLLRYTFRWRPYRVECAGSLPTSEVKRRRARLVLGWGTAREDLRVLPALRARSLCFGFTACIRKFRWCFGTLSAGGHTASNAPDLFRPPKLSGAGPG